jgi:hypothetical protein
MLLSTPALVKTLPVSALKVLFVAKQSMFRPCGESTKLSHFSQSAYAQPFNTGLPMHSSYPFFRRGSPHSAMLNQLQNASRTNSSTPQKGLRIHTLSRFVVPTLNFYYSRVATLLTEKRRTRACCQVKSVKVRFPRRVQFSRCYFFTSTYICLRRFRVPACILMFLYIVHVLALRQCACDL